MGVCLCLCVRACRIRMLWFTVFVWWASFLGMKRSLFYRNREFFYIWLISSDSLQNQTYDNTINNIVYSINKHALSWNFEAYDLESEVSLRDMFSVPLFNTCTIVHLFSGTLSTNHCLPIINLLTIMNWKSINLFVCRFHSIRYSWKNTHIHVMQTHILHEDIHMSYRRHRSRSLIRIIFAIEIKI